MSNSTSNPETATEKMYIIPTKKEPVFQATCDYFGSIETGVYKNALIGNCTTDVFELSFIDAVNGLHNWIQENWWVVTENPKAKFHIYMLDGSVDKYGESKHKAVYSISSRKAKKMLTNKSI